MHNPEFFTDDRQSVTAVQTALSQLGYKCWHSTTCFGDTAQCRRWVVAQDAKFLQKGTPFTKADWDGIFHGYTAISADPPATGFREELISAYPDAKVILVERDEDAWFKSFEATVMTHLFRWDLIAASFMDPELIGPVRDMQCHWPRSWWHANSKAEMATKARYMFREHNRIVRELVPANRLLIYRFEDGWGPLCAFLGKEVPDVPFPVKHDRSQVKTRNRWIRLRGLQMLGKMLMMRVFAPVLVVGVMAWWLAGDRANSQ